MKLRFLPTLRYSNSPLLQRGSFLLIPLQHHAMDNPADFEQLFFVMHHFPAREAGDGIIFTQKNRLLGANLLAHPAENAADHVNIELLRIFFDFGEGVCRRDFARNNLNRAWRTNELAELTRDAADATIFISYYFRCTSVCIGLNAVRFFFRLYNGDLF